MILVPSFDIPSGFRLGKITEECPFQGPVFFVLINPIPTTMSSLIYRIFKKYDLPKSNFMASKIV